MSETIPVDDLQVHVGKGLYTGWKSVSVSRPLDAAAGTFQLAYASPGAPHPIERGDPVKVWLGDTLLLNGYVDALKGSLSGGGFTISGRDKTADLVDCSAVNLPGHFQSLAIEELVEALASPFGIPVIDDLGLPGGLFYEFALQNETAWQAIERACRLKGVLAYTTGDGLLRLVRAGEGRAADVELVEGENVLDASVNLTNADRFQFYKVQGSRSGDDSEFGDTVALVQGTAGDPGVDRYRPLLIQAEGAVTFESAEDRAQWEATVRAARSGKLTVDVVGWRQSPAGRVWRVNELCVCRMPSLGVKSRLLINRVTMKRSAAGSVTTLELIRPDAYTPKKEVSEAQDPFASFFAGQEEEE